MEELDLMQAGEKNTNVAKCPGCGANTVFSPDEQVLKCGHCGAVVDFPKSQKAEELSIANMMSGTGNWADETHVFKCDNCGAKSVLLKNEIAKQCSYCGTSNIVEQTEMTSMKPNAVVPFKITKEKASENYLAWVRKKLFAPGIFKKHASPYELKGVYNPCFTFDANTFSSYRGVLGKYYYRTIKTKNGTRTVREVRYFKISGVHNDFFDDILIQASKKIDQKTLNSLSPFNTNESKNYSQNFLFGFSANSNDKEGMACWTEARSVIDDRLKSRILSKYNYDTVRSLSVQTQCNDVKFKYILLPVYVGKCSWRQKIYNFFVNGFSGKVCGKTPLSAKKLFLAIFGGIALIAGGIIAGLIVSGNL